MRYIKLREFYFYCDWAQTFKILYIQKIADRLIMTVRPVYEIVQSWRQLYE